MPIDGVLDLHTFQPSDLPHLLTDYLEACRQEGFLNIRVIHGKGRGILRRRVHKLLQKHPAVKSFKDASPEAGGWGATIVVLGPME
ncbi:MAG: Smr/MutS family protein [Desulfosarcina sp.]|nr:Smr/MutS family protein [Desulfobacterales bacterium]